jgi:hypothetical protein
VAFFRRNTQSSRVLAPHMPPREQRRLIREADRQNYTSHGYRALTSYAFAKDIIPGKLVGLIHDQLTEGGGIPERSAVWVGVHDVDLGRGAAAVMGEKYSSAGATFGESLPQDGDESVEGRSLSTVLLFSPDGEKAERDRVRRVVALAQQYADRFTTVEQVRFAVVDQLSRQRLPTGRRVRLALAAAWSGHLHIAEDMTVALTAELEGPAIERLRELQSHRPE